MTPPVRATRLLSGYWHLRGRGPCNWAQPPHWPCDEETLRAHAFAQASEDFIWDCLRLAREADDPPIIRGVLAACRTYHKAMS